MTAAHRPPRRESARYHLIEAMRGLACLAVVLYHSLASQGAGLAPLYASAKQATDWGWLGVEVFFAISGWCIAERLAKAVEREEGAGHFIAERLLRIYPTYWAVIGLTVAIRLGSAPFNSVGVSAAFPHGGKAWIDTLLLTDQIGGTTPFLVVSWSLLYEFAFYACALLALGALRRRLVGGKALFAVGGVVAVVALILPGDSLPGRLLVFWMNFFVGVAAWWAARRERPGDGLFFLLCFLVVLVADAATRTPANGTALAMGLILWAGWHSGDQFAERPAVRSLRQVGAISYSLYLIHVPILSAIVNGGARLISPASLGFGMIWFGAVAAALAAGWAVHRWIERPFETWRRRAF